MSGPYADPNRKIALPFVAGDTWAQAGAQGTISGIQRLRVTTGAPVRWRVIGYDGTGPDAAPVTGDLTTVDSVVVKIKTDRRGNETLSRTATTVETGGAEVPTGKDLTERDVSAGDIIAMGVVSSTQDTAGAIWVTVDAGAVRV